MLFKISVAALFLGSLALLAWLILDPPKCKPGDRGFYIGHTWHLGGCTYEPFRSSKR
jgi:hypothetical protein